MMEHNYEGVDTTLCGVIHVKLAVIVTYALYPYWYTVKGGFCTEDLQNE